MLLNAGINFHNVVVVTLVVFELELNKKQHENDNYYLFINQVLTNSTPHRRCEAVVNNKAIFLLYKNYHNVIQKGM